MLLLLIADDLARLEPLAKCVRAHEHRCTCASLSAVCEDSDMLANSDALIYMPPMSSDDAVLTSASVDAVTRNTYRLVTQALDAGVRRFVLLSSMSMFSACSSNDRLDESWRPRPQPNSQMLPWLAERSLRELVRCTDAEAVCLRLGVLLDEEAVAAAILQALDDLQTGWQVRHVGERSHATIRDTRTARIPSLFDSRTAAGKLRVVVFGAGGPLGAAVADALKDECILTLTDVRPLDEIAAEGERRDQFPGAPVAAPLPPPHHAEVVDVTDADAVQRICAKQDAIINCSVARRAVNVAFRVNALGAFHIAQAAAAHGIRRIVQTGPQLFTLSGIADYSWDDVIPDDTPPRPGRHVYAHSKYLGQEMLRVFAEAGHFSTAVLLFDGLLQPAVPISEPLEPLAISWADAAQAIRAALVARLPSPYEVFTLNADLPHGRYSNRKAKMLLGWHPHDDLRLHWMVNP
jgi:nucleoside-diphosphate-sugar epimerase